MKKLILALTLTFFGTSALSLPQNANAFWWTIVRAVVTPKPTPKPKKSWWKSDEKDSKGWSNGDKSDPDWKQLNYREKDWYK